MLFQPSEGISSHNRQLFNFLHLCGRCDQTTKFGFKFSSQSFALSNNKCDDIVFPDVIFG